MGISDYFKTNPLEFQKTSKRIIGAVNPNLENIPTAFELRRRAQRHMEETGSRRILGYLKGGGPEHLANLANEGKKWAQVLLGWIKPWQLVIKVKPALDKWAVRGYRQKISEHEWSIARTRIKLMELGLKLRPYSAANVRRLEMKLLGFRLKNPEKKDYWWKR